MGMQLLYPRMVVSDLHAHERRSMSRMREVEALLAKLEAARTAYNVKTLIITGDMFDRNSPVSIRSIVTIGNALRKFDECVIIVGNHDTPVRNPGSTSVIDIFCLMGLHVISKTTVVGTDVFVPYYDVMPDTGIAYSDIYMHKDIQELNGYFDADFAITLPDVPQCTRCFNGHLHCAQMYTLPNGGTYIQAGSPYPTSWSDRAELNNSAYLLKDARDFSALELNITGDKTGTSHDAKFDFVRERSVDTSDAATDSLADISELHKRAVSIEQVLSMLDYPVPVNNVIKSMVSNETAKVDSSRF